MKQLIGIRWLIGLAFNLLCMYLDVTMSIKDKVIFIIFSMTFLTFVMINCCLALG